MKLESIQKETINIDAIKNFLAHNQSEDNFVAWTDRKNLLESTKTMNQDDREKVLELLALNIIGISSDSSLDFREELYKNGAKISYIMQSFEDTDKNNKKVKTLHDKFLDIWSEDKKMS